MAEPLRCEALGLGVVIDEGQPALVITTGADDQPIFVVLQPDVAFEVGMTLMTLATEARILADQLADMTPEQVQETLNEIQRRNLRDSN
jgi:hypothetical protein